MGTATSRLGQHREDNLHGEHSTNAVHVEGTGPDARDGTEQSGGHYQIPRPRKSRVTHDATPEISPHARPPRTATR